MSVISDPIGDMLTRIRNASRVGHPEVAIPASNEKAAIANVLKDEGYINEFRVDGEGTEKALIVKLKYVNEKSVITTLKRVSKPSCRTYVSSQDIPRVRGGLGIAIVSTPEGVLSGRVARRKNVGGELLCYIW
ncbi:MAG: 30S ribosomal protein S8 [Lentisphaeria bacterium]|nr:30S ribosomal protein S8 [Lentisphaeria bacterium]NQZ67475.1 30S ribosomal protein S8 [Lentisphaeria bacterium]